MMSNYTRSTVSTINGVNAETQKIQTAVNSKMDKTGGAFTGTVDMNEQRLINLPDATSSSEPVTLNQLRDTLDNITVGIIGDMTYGRVVPSLKHLVPVEDIIQPVASYVQDTGFGGGDFIYDALMPYSAHNGGTVFAKEALDLWNGQQSTIAVVLNYSDSGFGCYVRQRSRKHVEEFGAIPDGNLTSKTGTDNLPSFRKIFQVFSEVRFDGGGAYRLSDTVSPNKKFKLYGGDSTWFCSDKTKAGINLAGCSGFRISWGDFTHLTVKTDYNDATCMPFFFNSSTQQVSDGQFYHSYIYRTARQGIRNDGGGSNWEVVICKIEETLRDGVFLLNCSNSQVSLCTITNTGDDAISFAGHSYNATATSNIIKGAGSYNLGGSGIRFNRSGSATSNIIEDSDLFGIICAVNDTDPTARPESLKLIGNTIKGINKAATVTAGIGFKSVINVECVNNDIEITDVESYGYRVYDTAVKSGIININGGVVKNAISAVYIRNRAADVLSISNLISDSCDDHILLNNNDGTLGLLKFTANNLIGAATPYYFNINTSTAAPVVIDKIISEGNRRENPATQAFKYTDKVVNSHVSTDDQFATGVYADTLGTANLGSLIINGRYGEKLSAKGTATFNATNSGLIAINLPVVPLGSEVSHSLRTSLGAASYYYIDNVDSLNIRFRLDAAPGSIVSIDWSVQAYNNRVVI